MNTHTGNIQSASRDRVRSLVQQGDRAGPLVLLLWPLVLLAFNRNWLFLNTIVDEWLYFGYFNNLRQHLAWFTGLEQYHSTRLPWILPGHIIYQIFPFPLSNYVLHLGIYYISVFSIYGTVRLITNARAAFITALLIGSYSYFLAAMGWDYVDGAGIAYMSATLLFLALSFTKQPRLIWLFLSGMTAAAAIYTNLFLVTLLAPLGFLYLLFNRAKPIRSIVIDGIVVVLSVNATSILLGFANVYFGGEFNFYNRSIYVALYLSTLKSNPWITTYADWPIKNNQLIYLWITVFGSIAILSLKKLRQRLYTQEPSVFYVLYFIAVTAIMVFFQIRGGTPVLQATFYASYIIPSMFIVIGILISFTSNSLKPHHYAVFVFLILASSLLNFLFRSCFELPLVYPSLISIGLGILLVCSSLFGAGRYTVPINIALLSGFITLLPSAFPVYQHQSFCVVNQESRVPYQNNYEAVKHGMATLNQMSAGKYVYFWYDRQENSFYNFFAGAYLGYWSRINEAFPSLDSTNSVKGHPADGDTIIVLSQRDSAIEEAEQALKTKGLSLNMLNQELILDNQGKRFSITLFTVQAGSSSSQPHLHDQ